MKPASINSISQTGTEPRVRGMSPGTGAFKSLGASLVAAALAMNATAGTVTLTAGDGYGEHSFDTAGHWDSGAAPSSGNDYFTGAFILRSPTSGSPWTFAGNSLTISAGGAMYAKQNPATVTVNNLTVNGRVNNAQGGVFTLLGNMNVPAPGGFMDTGSGNTGAGDNRSISNAMTISGTGTLTNTTLDTQGWPNNHTFGTVMYSGNNSGFTGAQVVNNNTIVQVASQANLGGNPASFNPAQLLLNWGTLRPIASFSLNNPNSGITIGTGGGNFNIASGLILTNANALAGAGTLALTNAGTLVQAGSAANFTGTLAVNGGTLILAAGGSLAGANTLSIGSAGTFDVTPAGITLATGQTLAGSGKVLGTVTAGTGSSLSPGGTGTAATLTLSNLTLSGGAALVCDFPATNLNDIVALTGDLSVAGATTIQLLNVPPVGTYPLLTVAGALGGSAANFKVAALTTRVRNYAVVYDTASSPKRILLQVTSSGAAANLAWQGNGVDNLWDIATSQNWLNGSNKDMYYDADTVNFTDAGAVNPPVLNVVVNPGAVIFNSTNAYNLTGTGMIAGASSLTQSGSGTTMLSLTNAYSGGTFITAGVLQVGTNNALGAPAGSTPLASVSGTGTLDLYGTALDAQYTNAVVINGNGTSTNQGAIDNTVFGLSTGGGDVGIATLALAGDSTVSASSTWQIGNTGQGIIGNGYTLTKIGGEANWNYLYLRHAAANPLGKLVIAGGGVLFYDHADAAGATTPIVLTNNGAIDTWNPGGYAYALTFANPIFVNDPVKGGRILNVRSPGWTHPAYDVYNGSITLNGPLTITNGSHSATTPETYGRVTVNGNITGSSGLNVFGDTQYPVITTSGMVYGGNLVTLNGNNSYSGPTLVSNLVQLRITTANQSGGSYTLVDYGLLDVAVAPGKPTIPMDSLTVNYGNVGASGLLGFTRLGAMPTSPVIYATNLNINSYAYVFPPLAGYSVGQFPLIKYDTMGGSVGFAGLMLGTLPAGVSATLVNNTANKTIDLQVTTAGIVWKGSSSSTWEFSTANWFNPSTSSLEVYQDGETVVFDDTAASYNVNIPAAVAPLGVTVNASKDYTFSGGTAIGNGAALVKNGSGTLTVACTNNTYTGGTYINQGTVKLADTNYAYPYGGGALNNNLGTVTVASGGTLDVNAVQVPNYQSYGPDGYDVYLSGAGVNGNGALVNNSTNNNDSADPGYVTLAGDATVGGIGDINIRHGVAPQLRSQSGAYTLTKVGPNSFRIRYLTTVSTNFGPIKILQGIVSYESSSAQGFGDPSKPIYVGSGAGFAWGTAATASARPIICSNNATLYGYNTTNNVFNSPVTLDSGNVNLNANYYNGLVFSNVLSGAGGVSVLYNSYVTFAASNTYSGNTTVWDCNAGAGSVLRLVGNGSINNSPYITLQGITASQALPGALDVSRRTDGTLTLVSGQTLRGDNGSYVRGSVVVSSGATITPGGTANIQYMSVSNNLTLQAGSTVMMEVSMNNGATNDLINVTGAANYGGTLQLVNIGTNALVAGNSFKLFKSGSYTGNFATIAGSPGAGLAWSFDPASGVASVVSAVKPQAVITSVTCSGANLVLSGTNGAANGTYYVLTSPDVTLALTNWTPILTNTFDSTGHFNVTNAIVPNTPKSFFLIRQ